MGWLENRRIDKIHPGYRHVPSAPTRAVRATKDALADRTVRRVKDKLVNSRTGKIAAGAASAVRAVRRYSTPGECAYCGKKVRGRDVCSKRCAMLLEIETWDRIQQQQKELNKGKSLALTDYDEWLWITAGPQYDDETRKRIW